MKTKISLLLALVLLAACAGPNPNPGERTTDMAWSSGDYDRAFSVAELSAERGEPWAQLRLGIFYSNGWGVDPDNKKAEYWYKKASVHKAKGEWENGQLVGAVGKSGYFNQNSDALIAEYNLADMYFNGPDGVDKDLVTAYVLITDVLKESNGKPVFFCCEFAGGRSFTQQKFTDLRDKIKVEMSKEQLMEAEELIKNNGA